MDLISISIGGASTAPQTWLSTVIPGVTVALIAGVVLFLLNWLREWLTDYWRKKSEAEVLAFSLVTLFDTLISECADVVDDPLQMDSSTGVWHGTVRPPTITFPDDARWTVFPKSLQYKIRSVPNKIDVANRNVASISEYGDGPPDYDDAFEERRWRYSWIGLEACMINDQLAEKYGVPTLERGEWTPEERFKREIEEIDTRRKEEKANHWPQPDWLFPEVPIEELKRRHSKLAMDLEVARNRIIRN